MSTRSIVCLLACALLLFGHATPAHAIKFWKNGVATGAWSTSNNWSAVSAAGADNGGVPVVSESTRIVHTDGVARAVTLDVTPPALGLLSIDLTGTGSTVNTLSITSNVSLTASAIGVGGFNGAATTNGRGAMTQSAGTVSTSAGSDFVVAWGPSSSGTYTLSGGNLVAIQSEFIGNGGTAVFNHTGGVNTINAGAIGSFNVGTLAGSVGNYNLSGTGQLVSNKSEYIGDAGTATFTQTGGTNLINGANSLVLGYAAGGSGTYTISAGSMIAGNSVTVGQNGLGTLNISGSGFVSVGANLSINSSSHVNLSGGTLRLNTGSGLNRVNYTAGTVRLAGNRNLNNDPVISVLFAPADYSIPAGKTLEIEQVAEISGGSNFSVVGGTLRSLSNGAGGGDFRVGENATGSLQIFSGGQVSGNFFQIGSGINASGAFNGAVRAIGAGSTLSTSSLKVGGKGSGTLEITSGATVTTSSSAQVGGSSSSELGAGTVSLKGAGSSWTVGSSMGIGAFGAGTVSIETGTTLDVQSGIGISSLGAINLNGGMLKFSTLSGGERVNFASGTIHAYGNHTLGTDASITPLFGVAPTITSGKNLTVAGLATLNTRTTIDGGVFTVGSLNSGGTVAAGGNLDFIRGTLKVTNQPVDITGSGPLGGIVDLNDDAILEADMGVTNYGLVTGDGEIRGVVTNVGQLRADPGKSLRLASPATNQGRVNLAGGLLDFDQTLTNQSSGLISGNGTLIARNGLTNQGTMNFAGTANLFGDVTNAVGAKVISGGGGATIFFDDVVNNGEVRTSANGFTVFYGSVTGAGNFTGTGTVNFEGDLTPGNSPAAVSFGGDVSFGPDAAVRMELGGLAPGGDYDQLLVSDALALDGALHLTLINGFNPMLGQTFNLFDWSSLSSEFSSVSLPALSSGLVWNTSQLYTMGMLSVAPGLAGDYNADGVVDAADYTVWRDSAGSTTNLSADGDSDGIVDADDWGVWRMNYGETSPSTATVVPEAASCLFVACSLAVAAVRRKRPM